MKFKQLDGTRLFYAAVLVLGLGWMWLSANPQDVTEGKIPAPQAGFLAPDFTLKTPDGQAVRLADYRGKVVLVNIWASWCPPCRAEMPAIERVYQTYKDKGFIVLAVDSTSQDTLANAIAFIAANKLSFPILLDDSGSVTRSYRVQSLPSSFFVGPDGVISEVVVGGPMAEALISSRVEKLLEERR